MKNPERAALGVKRPIAVDLFSGCGGLTAGLESAGFVVKAAVESDRKAQETYALNHPRVHLYRKDIRLVDPLVVLKDLSLEQGELDLLAGCPPCQGFSRLRTKNKSSSIDDVRNDLVNELIRFVQVLLPKTLMVENVPSLMRDERFEDLERKVAMLGYQSITAIVDAADYGVPQRRKRLILLASRVHKPKVAEKHVQRFSVRWAIESLESPLATHDEIHALPERRSEKVKETIRLIPKDGGSRSDLPEQYRLACHRKISGFHDVYGRMAWDDVSPTITSGCINPSKGRFLHPIHDRTITLREAALLQGFPQDYKFIAAHGKEAIALMIGNALPPPLIAMQAADLKHNVLKSVHYTG